MAKEECSPGTTLDTEDQGDDMQARIRYQHTYTAIQCLRLLEDNGPAAIYCENHEDILVEGKSDKYVGIQVKSRQFARKEFSSTDPDFKKSIARFARLETKFPNQFSKYVFVTNHSFRANKDSQHLNPDYLIKTISSPDILESLPTDGPLKKILKKLSKDFEVEENKIISAITKTKIEGFESGLTHLEFELAKLIQTTCNLGHKPSKLSDNIAEKLIKKIYYASSNSYKRSIDLYDPNKSFVDVVDELILNGKRIQARVIERLIDETIEQFVPEHIHLAIESNEIARPNFQAITDYLPRTIYDAKELDHLSKYFLDKNKKKDTLQVIREEKRIVILGDGGMGKSVELDRIAAYFSVEGRGFYPCPQIYLNKYVNQNIEDLLPKGWNSLPQKSLLIILDGLDEIESKNKNDANRKIEYFSDKYPVCTMIISCRRNFYKIAKEHFTGTLEKFHPYVLLKLEPRSIEKYVGEKIGIKSKAFLDQIYKSNISDLLHIPFYLVSLVEIYNKNGTLPDNKSRLFDNLIKLKIQLDETHFKNSINYDQKKDEIFIALQSVALCVEVLGRNHISKNELKTIIPDTAVRDLLNHSSVINKTGDKKITWQFEHNHIQEYLAASVLSNQALESIKNFTAFEPDYTKIIPTWINTIGFLLSISSNTKLLDWILDIEPEIVVHSEPNIIETSDRVAIFQKIFNQYKTKKIWINNDKFPYGDLSRFANVEDNINFLFVEAENAEHYTSFSNAIEMLGRMKLTGENRSRLKSLLLDASINNLHIEIPPHLQQSALELLVANNLNSPDVVKTIVLMLKDSENDWIRYGLYYFLHKSGLPDDYLDVFFDGIRFIRLRYSGVNRQTRSRILNERLELKNGLLKMITPHAIKTLISYFKDNGKDLFEIFDDDNDNLKKFTENVLAAYKTEDTIFDDAIQFFSCLMNRGEWRGAKSFAIFFDHSDTRLQAFKKILGIENLRREEMLSIVADQSCLEFLLTQYEENNVGQELIKNLLDYLNRHNKSLEEGFRKTLQNKYGESFKQPEKRNLAKEEKDRSQKDFDLLFADNQALIEQMTLIFKREQKESLTQKDTYELRTKYWPDIYYSDIALELIQNFAGDGSIILENALKRIQKLDWELFCVSRIYDILDQEKEIEISDSQKTWIESWCKNNFDKVNFRSAIEKTGKKSTSTRWNAIYMWSFFKRFHFDFPEKILLDMLSFDYNRTGIDYLEPYIDEYKMTDQVLTNLKTRIFIDSVLINHLKYCKKYTLSDCIPYALAEIVNTERDQYDDVRQVALEMICTMEDKDNILESILPKINDEFKWKIIDVLVENKNESAKNYLSELSKKNTGKNRIKAIEYLLSYQDMKALAAYVEYKKSEKQNNQQQIRHRSALKSLNDVRALPYLLDLLKHCYSEKIYESEDYDHDRMDRQVLKVMEKIALQSNSNFERVRAAIKNFINDNISEYLRINWLHSYLEGIEQQFYFNKSENKTIDDALNLMGQIKFQKVIHNQSNGG